jgi:hypothetical protein
MAGSGTQDNRQPKFLFARILIFDAAIFGVLRHGGVKIEAYFVAQVGNQHRLRSVDVGII